MKQKKILITGGASFMGSSLVKKLIYKGNDIRVLDNYQRGNGFRLQNELKKIEFIEGDIRDEKIVENACKNVDIVFHLAYLNGTKFFYEKPEIVLDIAVKGIVNIIKSSINNSVSDFFLASSSEVYQNPIKIPTDEREMLKIPDIHNPRYSYGGGKILYELFGKHYMPDFFSKLILFRPFNVYGPKMDPGHVIPDLLSKIKKMKIDKPYLNFEVSGSADQTRSFEYIDDFVDGFEIVMEKGTNREIYNIGNDEEVSIKLLIEKMFKLINPKLKINIIDKKDHVGSPTRRCPDISKLKNLGYKPKINLDKGLRKMITGKF